MGISTAINRRSGGAPTAKSANVSSTATGTIFTLTRLLGGSSTLSLIAGTNSNLTLSGLNVQAAVALGTATQVANVREANGSLAVEYPLSLTGVAILAISGSPSAGTVGAAYSFTPTVTGGSGTKSFSLSGTLPSWAAFNSSTGAITGTPNIASTTSGLSITVSDLTGSVTLGPFSISTSIAGTVLSITSAAGTAPVTFDITNAAQGYFVELQIATDSGFTSITQDVSTLITSADTASQSLTQAYTDPSGTYYARARYWFETDDGSGNITPTYGSWSNTVTDTISSAVTVFTTTNGASKQQFNTVSNDGNGRALILTSVNNGLGTMSGNRGTASGTGKRHFELTVNALDTLNYVGVDNGTDNFNSGFPLPGNTDSTGVQLRFSSTAFDIFAKGSAQSSASSAFAVGDIIAVEYDTAGGTVSFYKVHSGITTQIGSTVTGLALSPLFPFAGFQDQTTGAQMTLNCGQYAFAMTPSTGYIAHG